jgi:quercetin dioxygenase-like cupin family protein
VERICSTHPARQGEREEDEMPDGYTISSVDDFEEMEGSGNATWRLARKSLGAEAFGFNVVDIEPGGQIPEHDHSGDNQEEVFIILDGQATIVTDGEEHDAPAGTFCRYAPEVRRTIRNNSDGTVRALLIGVPVDSGYVQMPWG